MAQFLIILHLEIKNRLMSYMKWKRSEAPAWSLNGRFHWMPEIQCTMQCLSIGSTWKKYGDPQVFFCRVARSRRCYVDSSCLLRVIALIQYLVLCITNCAACDSQCNSCVVRGAGKCDESKCRIGFGLTQTYVCDREFCFMPLSMYITLDNASKTWEFWSGKISLI